MGSQLILAFIIDLAAGEQRESLHPVCWMGNAIELAENLLLEESGRPGVKRANGVLAAMALPAAAYLLSRKLLGWLPRPLAGVAEVGLLTSVIACRSLHAAAVSVEDGLGVGLGEGRRSVAHLVGRDTETLDEDGVIRAAIESVAENANDGVIAPLLYGLVGGAPLALAYRMVNTMDSMIGYRDGRYSDFGWAAARMDDAASWLPARITAVVAAVASPVVGGSTGRALAVWRRDAGGHSSPNAGVCEAAFAGALGVRLGGSSYYGGRLIERPEMGEELAAPARRDIGRAAILMYTAAALFVTLGAMLKWIIRRNGGHGGKV